VARVPCLVRTPAGVFHFLEYLTPRGGVDVLL
jgi:hypothetical protein